MTNLPPAGWYRDPRNPDQPHYWDGQGWAELAPKPPPPPVESSLPLAELPPPTRAPVERQKRSQVVVAGLVTLAVVALIAIGAAVQSLSGGHGSTPTKSSVPSTGLPTSPQ